MDSQIKKFANEIANEIAGLKMIDVEGLSVMIEVRIKSNMLNFVNEYTTKEELEYLRLINEQSKNKLGTPKYNETAYKLTAAKARKTAANRAANNVKRKDDYESLKKWVKQKYGEEAFEEFTTLKSNELPIYSTT